MGRGIRTRFVCQKAAGAATRLGRLAPAARHSYARPQRSSDVKLVRRCDVESALVHPQTYNFQLAQNRTEVSHAITRFYMPYSDKLIT